MDQAWFYFAGGQTVGPVSLDELRAAQVAGVVGHDTKVRPGPSGNWYLAGEVPGLLIAPFVAAPGAVVAPPLPPTPPPAPPTLARDGVPPSFAPPSPPPPPPPGAGASRTFSRPRRKSRSVVGILVSFVGFLLLGGVIATAAWMVVKASHSSDSPLATAQVSKPTAEPKKTTPPSATSTTPAENETVAKADTATEAKRGPMWAGLPDPTKAGQGAGQSDLYEGPADLAPANKIDELVFAKLKSLKIEPASLCSDAVFVRRIYLDMLGTLPTADEVKRFLQDKSPNKRKTLIDQVLERDEYADYWAMKWSDILRIKAEFPINLWPTAAQAYHRWVHTCLKDNMPYDQFVREMLTACGSNFRVGQVNFYRALQSKKPGPITKAVALTFMGVRTDGWPKERLDGMSKFFSMIGYKGTAEWKEEIIMFDPGKAKTPAAPPAKPADAPAKPAPAKATKPAPPPADSEPLVGVFPDGTSVELNADRDPREVFADWLITYKNPYFSRTIVNRIWYWLLGRGIVHEPDDFRPDNPPQNPQLLDYLAQELVSSRYNMKHIYRLILNSKTYQLSCVPKSKSADAPTNFAFYALRRLEAEVLIDAVCQITGSTESYNSLIPEPFTWIPENQRTITLPDGSITSSFLEMFGRPPRDTGMESERNNRTTAAQRLHMLNSTHIRQKIERSAKLQEITKSTRGQPKALAEQLYLTILSRLPSDDELETVRSYQTSEIAWALMNTAEFLYRH